MKERHDLYSFPHKTIERFLYSLGHQINIMDINDDSQLNEHKTTFADFKFLILKHGDIEDEIFPIFNERLQGNPHESSEQDHKDHKDLLEVLENKLNKLKNADDLSEKKALYLSYRLDLRNFIQHTLKHMLEEEEAQRNEIWPNFTDQDIQEVEGNLMETIEPEVMARIMPMVYVSININEQAHMNFMMKLTSPPDVYETKLKVLMKSLVSADRWSKIEEITEKISQTQAISA